MIRKSLAELLVEKNIFTFHQVEEFVKESQNINQTLIEYLINKSLIGEDTLAQITAEQFELQYIPKITEEMTDPDILLQVPLRFLREHGVIPAYINGKLYIITHDPLNFQTIDELSLILESENRLAISSKHEIIEAVNKYYPLEGTRQMIEDLEEENSIDGNFEFGQIEESDILEHASDAPIIKLVNHILYQAVKKGASDIHIEPFEKELRVRYRIDGILYPSFNPPKRIQGAIISRIKIMANLNIAEKRLSQDGRIQIKIADKAIDIRVSILPVAFGERVVMRLLDKTKNFTSLDNIGFNNRDLRIIQNSILEPNGIILITGPTGSGKTSTLYSILNQLNSPEVNIVTVEDPVEYQMSGIGQVQVKEKIGLTFQAALRSILRQDPDIVMIGETRDFETAQIAIQSALTGHLVLSTLHTNNAPASITRLIDMGIEPFLIASTLVCAVAQRLVRKICLDCRKAYIPSQEALKRIGAEKEDLKNITFYQAVGCPNCSNTGYKGRLAIFEIMTMTKEIAKLTVERADSSLIKDQAIKDGMTLLVQDGLNKAKQGLTTIEEILSVTTSEHAIDA